MHSVESAFVLHLPPNPARLALGQPHDPFGDGYIREFDVLLTDNGLTAATAARVAAFDLSQLDAFLQSLADDWRGWDGTRVWESLERELRFNASHDRRRLVSLLVTVGPGQTHGSVPWSASAVFEVEPGEQMQNIAREVAMMLGPAPTRYRAQPDAR